jgi:SAM-dependent methyltransferase
VLEIGCGAGLGLGYLARFARKVVGGDIEEKNVSLARQFYKDRPNITIDLRRLKNMKILISLHWMSIF